MTRLAALEIQDDALPIYIDVHGTSGHEAALDTTTKKKKKDKNPNVFESATVHHLLLSYPLSSEEDYGR
jgi:hypothetical protein